MGATMRTFTVRRLAAAALLAVLGTTVSLVSVAPPVGAAVPFVYSFQWGSKGNGNGQFDQAEGVAVDGSGNVYVADTLNWRIQRFDSSGNYVSQWGGFGNGPGKFEAPSDVAVDSSGDVYVADSGNNRIQKFDSSNAYVTQWGSFGTANGQFNNPTEVAVGPSGDVYVADSFNNRIEKFDSSGTFLTAWGTLGTANGQFNSPEGVATDSSGDVYVADKFNNRIEVFDANGTFLKSWTNPFVTGPVGIAVSSTGDVFVDDNHNNRVDVFDTSGNLLSKFGSTGTGNGQFEAAASPAVDGSGNVYVPDQLNNNVQVFIPGPVVTPSPVSIAATEGHAFSGAVATFTSSDTTALASQYTVSITWGDGTSTTGGTVAGGSGSFTVSGVHTYADENDASSVMVSVTDTSDSNTVTVSSPATVSDASLSGETGSALSGTEGTALTNVTVATFTDGNPLANVADFTSGGGAVTIDWGDASTTAATVIKTGPGQFSVSGTHTYSEEGVYSLKVHIADGGGNTAAATGTASIGDAALVASGVPALTSTGTVSSTLATFSDNNPLATVTDFTSGGGAVTINWGDTTSSAATVTQTGIGQFSANGTHTYGAFGPYTITVSVTDAGGSSATATTSVVVYAFPAGGDFVIGDGNDGPGTSVTFWGAGWASANTLSGGTAPSSFKGFESGTAVPACNGSWTVRPGNSSSPPNGPLPSYLGVIVSSSVAKSGSTISGNVPHIVVVKTNGGYGPDPGHAGTGVVVALAC
jgi:NHL repeat